MNVQTWSDLVQGRDCDGSAAAARSFLEHALWLASIGRLSNRDDSVMRACEWPRALSIFNEGGISDDGTRKTYNENGTLSAPLLLLLERLDSDDSLNRKTAEVANRALDDLVLTGYRGTISRAIRAAIDAGDLAADHFETKIAVGDYAQEYIRLLFIEIYAGDISEPRCTYFRDQLGWFLAGFLPCGWDGEWPHGRMRVF